MKCPICGTELIHKSIEEGCPEVVYCPECGMYAAEIDYYEEEEK
jgi:uncharacterized Zn finger protein